MATLDDLARTWSRGATEKRVPSGDGEAARCYMARRRNSVGEVQSMFHVSSPSSRTRCRRAVVVVGFFRISIAYVAHR